MSLERRARQSNRSLLEQEFVNLYRNNWGSNEGLDSARIHRMSDRELEMNVRSQKMFAEQTERSKELARHARRLAR